MKKVFMIHGFKGEPNGGWLPWLMSELEKHDIYACALPMPTPDAPVKNEWIQTINEAVGDSSNEIFLIGHSLGVAAILRYLETIDVGKEIGGAVLVAGRLHEANKEGYEYVDSFLKGSFDFNHIKNVCKNIAVIHGDNDPNIPSKESEEMASLLSSDLVTIPNGKHLKGSQGWYQLPQVLDSLLKMTK